MWQTVIAAEWSWWCLGNLIRGTRSRYWVLHLACGHVATRPARYRQDQVTSRRGPNRAFQDMLPAPRRVRCAECLKSPLAGADDSSRSAIAPFVDKDSGNHDATLKANSDTHPVPDPDGLHVPRHASG